MRSFCPGFLLAGWIIFSQGCGDRAPKSEVEFALRTPEAGKPSGPHEAQEWSVYKGPRKVLVVKNRPGPILSTAHLPKGQKPARHPFLSGYALDPSEEDSLHNILAKSKNFQDFLTRLTQSSYQIQKN